jgi:hypothetical protein
MKTFICTNGLSIFISILLLIFIFSAMNCELGQSSNTNNSNGITIPLETDSSIIYLHHSTGGVIWGGGIPAWFTQYNSVNHTSYTITERAYPSGDTASGGYPWDNYPYDYWNIWIAHAGNSQYMKEDTLEILTANFDVIIWKHCFPVSGIGADIGTGDITSPDKRIENYKLQYEALKTKMHSFPNNRFIVWTGAALVQGATNFDQATRSQAFFNWVKNVWDEDGDNIFVWDFWQLETEGGLYLLPAYASSSSDSHPTSAFANTVAPYLCNRIIDVIHGYGDTGSLTGQ